MGKNKGVRKGEAKAGGRGLEGEKEKGRGGWWGWTVPIFGPGNKTKSEVLSREKDVKKGNGNEKKDKVNPRVSKFWGFHQKEKLILDEGKGKN